MDFNSGNFATKFVIIYIIIGSMLIGCSTPYHYATLISSVHYSNGLINSYSTINSAVKSTQIISSFPKNITISGQNSSINKPIYQPKISVSKASTDNRIIYKRNYNDIQKGTFDGNHYTVKQGDTLFYIAWITNNDYHNLAKRNKITKPYGLNVGQVLNIINSFAYSEMVITSHAINTSNININFPLTNAHNLSISKQNLGKILLTAYKPLTSFTLTATTASIGLNNNGIMNTIGKWCWPAEGKVIEFFSDVQGGNKGVDIAGSYGQAVFATTAGKVVYSGNALRGYGNIILIKHNDEYLSAYAHNETILVHDQQKVYAGQKIATMGSTGTSSARLHFEIRHKGKSVNPLHYLSKR